MERSRQRSPNVLQLLICGQYQHQHVGHSPPRGCFVCLFSFFFFWCFFRFIFFWFIWKITFGQVRELLYCNYHCSLAWFTLFFYMFLFFGSSLMTLFRGRLSQTVSFYTNTSLNSSFSSVFPICNLCTSSLTFKHSITLLVSFGKRKRS